jgi:Spy/CpxP family protein refolding chaperone
MPFCLIFYPFYPLFFTNIVTFLYKYKKNFTPLTLVNKRLIISLRRLVMMSAYQKNKRSSTVSRKIILAGALSSALSLSALASSIAGMDCDKNGSSGFEKDRKDGKHKGYGEIGGHMVSLSTVKLSSEQKAKINAINDEFRSEMAKLHIKEKPIMKDPFAVAGGFNKELFKKESSEKMQKHLELQAEHLEKIWNVLTAEQQKSIAALAK